jgi:hypothetical protein
MHVQKEVALGLSTDVQGVCSLDGSGQLDLANAFGFSTFNVDGQLSLTGANGLDVQGTQPWTVYNYGAIYRTGTGAATLPKVDNTGLVSIAAGCELDCNSGPSIGFLNEGSVDLANSSTLYCGAGQFSQVLGGPAPPVTWVMATSSQPNPTATINAAYVSSSSDPIAFLAGQIWLGTHTKGVAGYATLALTVPDKLSVQLGGSGSGSGTLTADLNVDGTTTGHTGSIQSSQQMVLNPSGTPNFSINFGCGAVPQPTFTYNLLTSTNLTGTCTVSSYGVQPPKGWLETFTATALVVQPREHGMTALELAVLAEKGALP